MYANPPVFSCLINRRYLFCENPRPYGLRFSRARLGGYLFCENPRTLAVCASRFHDPNLCPDEKLSNARLRPEWE